MEVFQFYTVDEANRRVKTIAEQNFRAAKKEVKTIILLVLSKSLDIIVLGLHWACGRKL